MIDDSDEDSLPDSWEMQYLGNLAAGPGNDADGDGQDNAAEYLTGSDPDNGTSRFMATVQPAGNGFSLVWPSLPGRLYQIQQSPSISGEWSLLQELPGSPAPATHTGLTIPASGDRRFYRVTVQP